MFTWDVYFKRKLIAIWINLSKTTFRGLTYEKTS